MKPENEIDLGETPSIDCSVVNVGYNLLLSQASEMTEITNCFIYYMHLYRAGKRDCKNPKLLREDISEKKWMDNCGIGSSPIKCTKYGDKVLGRTLNTISRNEMHFNAIELIYGIHTVFKSGQGRMVRIHQSPKHAILTQMVECTPDKRVVSGSSPLYRTNMHH